MKYFRLQSPGSRLQAPGSRLQGLGIRSLDGSQAGRSSVSWRLEASAGLVLLLFTGCGVSSLQEDYGRRNGPTVYASVNGTAVFGQMCEARGHKVYSWPVLSPRIQNEVDCVVWFPDDYHPPGRDVQMWLERWLKAKPNRTLIYVGRHFDAAAWYWENVGIESLPTKEQAEVGRRRKKARSEFGQDLKGLPKANEHEWFEVDGRHLHRKIRTLDSDSHWTEGIDPAKTSMELNTRLIPPADAEVLLGSQEDAIVFRETFGQSQLIVVANGSFLLNAPLANSEHRRLAGKLIDEIGPPQKTVAFLEFDEFGAKIADEDPSFGPQLGFQVFHVWPTNWIMMHVCLLGVLLCFWRFPIFGRPIDPESESTSDFGLHIDAVARLLARTEDTAFAHARLQHYRQTTKPEAQPKIFDDDNDLAPLEDMESPFASPDDSDSPSQE